MGSYVPTTAAEREQMLSKIGVESMEELYAAVPREMLLQDGLDLPAGLSELDSVLNGTTSLATTNADPIAPFRIIKDFAGKLPKSEEPKFVIKAAFMDGKMLSESEVNEIATLPSKDALYGKVLGTMLAPITSLAVVLGQILEQKGGSLESAPAAEE